MHSVSFILSLAIAVVTAVPTQKIVGGSETTIDQYPSSAALLYTFDFSTFRLDCGGVIINSRYILTVASCTKGTAEEAWRIRVGSSVLSSGGSLYDVSNILLHPRHINHRNLNDIALMQTSAQIIDSDNVKAAFVAGADYVVPDNSEVWIAGWGNDAIMAPMSDQLRHVRNWIINHETCVNNYKDLKKLVTDKMICAGSLQQGGSDFCFGDQGTGLYHYFTDANNIRRQVAVGLASWFRGCGFARYPGVHTSISQYIEWIQANAV